MAESTLSHTEDNNLLIYYMPECIVRVSHNPHLHNEVGSHILISRVVCLGTYTGKPSIDLLWDLRTLTKNPFPASSTDLPLSQISELNMVKGRMNDWMNLQWIRIWDSSLRIVQQSSSLETSFAGRNLNCCFSSLPWSSTAFTSAWQLINSATIPSTARRAARIRGVVPSFILASRSVTRLRISI